MKSTWHTSTDSSSKSSIEQFRLLAKSSAIAWEVWFVPIGMCLGVMAFLTGAPWLLIPAIFLTLVGIAERTTPTRIRKAVEAYENGPGEEADLSMEILRWSDDDRYLASVSMQDGARWSFECVPARDLPSPGEYKARIWRDPKGVPILGVVDDSMLIPRQNPVRADRRGNEEK